MRNIRKQWSFRLRQSKQLEFVLGNLIAEEKGKRLGFALRLAVAGAVSLLAAVAIHNHLLLVVAPAAFGLLLWAAWVWHHNKNGRGNSSSPSVALPLTERDNSCHLATRENKIQERKGKTSISLQKKLL